MTARSALSRKEIRRAAHEWRDLSAQNALSELEAKAFAAWLAADVRHQQAYDRAVTVWSSIEYITEEDIDADLRARSRGERVAALSGLIRDRLGSTGGRLTAAAIGCALVLPLLLWSASEPTTDPLSTVAPIADERTYLTTTRETSRITLPDGTRATLGAATQLRYVAEARARRVHLDRGEVFFEVAPDSGRPFSVRAGALVMTAIGTAFEVRANGGVSRVAVSEGVVAARFPIMIGSRQTGQYKQVRLTAGRRAAAAGYGLSDAQPIAAANIGAWREQRLIYSGATLAELLADLQRYADLAIDIDPALDLSAFGTVSASFSSRDITQMLATLPQLFPISITSDKPGRIAVAPKDNVGA